MQMEPTNSDENSSSDEYGPVLRALVPTLSIRVKWFIS
jgi:hypothetical protein